MQECQDSSPEIVEAARLVARSKYTIALTGAGVSVPSGIPDFRAFNGLWRKYPIVEYATVMAYRQNPEKVWQMFKEVEENVATARPNPAHEALASLEQMGLLKCIVTQNIDGLHQAAGSTCVHEFHGSYRQLDCLFCGSVYPGIRMAELRDPKGIPRCACGQPLKPSIVLFGESIPRSVLDSTMKSANLADLILVVGTSAQVAPASELPGMIGSRGGKIVEMNLARTDLSPQASVHISGDVSVTLPALLQCVKSLVNSH